MKIYTGHLINLDNPELSQWFDIAIKLCRRSHIEFGNEDYTTEEMLLREYSLHNYQNKIEYNLNNHNMIVSLFLELRPYNFGTTLEKVKTWEELVSAGLIDFNRPTMVKAESGLTSEDVVKLRHLKHRLNILRRMINTGHPMLFEGIEDWLNLIKRLP